MQSGSIDQDVADAMRWAREQCGMTPEQFARELNRLVPDGRVDAETVVRMESLGIPVPARYLVAAARLVEQPVSVVLGELDLYEVTIPQLEKRLAAVEARLERTSA